MSDVPLLEATVEIDTPPARVWELVFDLPRMSSWSPMVLRTVVLGSPVGVGTHAVNVNRRGPMVWPFSLTPLDDGTRTHVVQRRTG